MKGTNTVLVTQAGMRNGYVITYALGSMGFHIHCADAQKYTQTRFSRFCSSYDIYPSPHCDPDGYFSVINHLIDKYSIDVIAPAYDEMIFLSQNRHCLKKPGTLFCSKPENILKVHSKPDLFKLCVELGCNAPATYEVLNESDINTVIEKLSFPLVLKPERGGGGWAVSFITSKDELIRKWAEFDTEKHHNRLFVQQYIKGPLYGYGALCKNGTILASNCYHTVRQNPIGRGTPSFRRGCIIDEIEKQAEIIFRHLEWNGVCQFDFLQDEKDGKVYLIDGNPRFWGSTAHGLASGINFPYLFYCTATNLHDGTVIRRTGNDKTSSWFWGDLFVLITRLRTQPEKLTALIEHFSGWIGTYFDDLKITDPLPFLFYPLQKLFQSKDAGDAQGF
jgi:predicted ATP-grasp superfamily ATP-dependent carboligase